MMKMPYMTLSTTQSDEHFYSPINIYMSGETAKQLPCEASIEQYIWGSLQFVDLLSSGAALSFSVKPPKKCPSLSCSFRGEVYNQLTEITGGFFIGEAAQARGNC